jgi:A/G-specific adenine glycosylase
MLQQTQVARVLEKFGPFIERFPTIDALAAADEHDVLARWSGMGYYRRARSLHAAARAVVKRFGGRVPHAVSDLLELPGVGRYTAGAIASIVYGQPEPIVDGNVARVLLRIRGKELGPAAAGPWAWTQAQRLVGLCRPGAATGPGLFNEGLMELGATICTPRGARCESCSLSHDCRAFSKGLVDRIPRPKRAGGRPPLHCASIVIEDRRGRLLVERKTGPGLWQGLWQAPTLESAARSTRSVLARWIGAQGLERIDRFTHPTTHRNVELEVWRGRGPVRREGAAWRTRAQIRKLPLSSVQRRVLLGVAGGAGAK